jgi:two-component system nitrate/nitrite response regulator NarL
MDRAPIRLMVVDDHTLFRRGLVSLLAADGRFEVVAEAGDATQALADVARCRPDVMLLDNHLPGAAGVDAVPALLQALPGLRILVLTMSEDERDLAQALRGGASGYLLKSAESDELCAAIERAMRGESSISAPMTAKLGAAFRLTAPGSASLPPAAPGPEAAAPGDATPADRLMATLSARERETLALVARGDSNKEIARTLGIAEATVKIHVQNLLRKLGLDSRVQAAAWYASRPGDEPPR